MAFVGNNPGGLTLRPEELQLYKSIYNEADPSNMGQVSGALALPIFSRANIPRPTLQKIWQIADTQQVGYLTQSQFFTALKLIAVAQSGKEPSLAAINIPGIGLPNLGQDQSPMSKGGLSGPSKPVSTGSGWAMTSLEKAKYDQLFQSLQPVKGVLLGNKVKGELMKSSLSIQQLGAIWQLADTSQNGSMNLSDFRLAMHLVKGMENGLPLPSQLPAELIKSNNQEEEQAPLEKRDSAPNIKAPWCVPVVERLQSYQSFKNADKDGDEMVTGSDVLSLFQQSSIGNETLARIWALVDFEESGKLDVEQFTLAMYLIHLKQKGTDIPISLTTLMIPPGWKNRLPSKVIVTGEGKQTSLPSTPNIGSSSSLSMGGVQQRPLSAASSSGTPGKPFGVHAISGMSPAMSGMSPAMSGMSPAMSGMSSGMPGMSSGMSGMSSGMSLMPGMPKTLMGQTLDLINSEVMDLENKRLELEAEIQRKESLVEQRTTDVSMLEAELKSTQKQWGEATVNKQNMQTKLALMNKKYDEYTQALRTVRDRYEVEKKATLALQQEINNESTSVKAYEEQLARAQDEIGNLKGRQAQLKDAVQSNYKELDDIAGLIKSTMAEITKVKGLLVDEELAAERTLKQLEQEKNMLASATSKAGIQNVLVTDNFSQRLSSISNNTVIPAPVMKVPTGQDGGGFSDPFARRQLPTAIPFRPTTQLPDTKQTMKPPKPLKTMSEKEQVDWLMQMSKQEMTPQDREELELRVALEASLADP